MKPLCVLGMHRSGTSMVTRLLYECGMHIGSIDDLMPPSADDNREGYWENQRIVDINNEILAALGGKWDAPPHLPSGWTQNPKLNSSRAKAKTLIDELAKYPFWGWKDPRTCITLEFWQELVPDLVAVQCIRHPVEVGQSFAARKVSYASRADAMKLWYDYNATVSARLKNVPHVVTHYASYFYDADAELSRILNLMEADLDTDRAKTATKAIKPELWRGFCLDDAEMEKSVPASALHLYQDLCQQAGPVYSRLKSDDAFLTSLNQRALQKSLDRIDRLERLNYEREQEIVRLLGRLKFIAPGIPLKERLAESKWIWQAIRRRADRFLPSQTATHRGQEN